MKNLKAVRFVLRYLDSLMKCKLTLTLNDDALTFLFSVFPHPLLFLKKDSLSVSQLCLLSGSSDKVCRKCKR